LGLAGMRLGRGGGGGRTNRSKTKGRNVEITAGRQRGL
jgi:hypothetical protein